MKNNIPDAVREASELNLHGNLIPHRWYWEIRTPGGLPDYAAITILSEIVYWYRPLKLLDGNGKPYLKKKFSGERFKCAAAYFNNKFGMPKDQTRNAIKRLVDRGLIDRYYDVGIIDGIEMYNMMFIEPVISEIKKISDVEFETETSRKTALNSTPSLQNDTPSAQNETPSLQNETVSLRNEELYIRDTKTKDNNNNNSSSGKKRNGKADGSGGSGSRLIFDFALSDWTASRRQRAEKALEALNVETAQAVLDELNESIAAGKVKQPLPWLRKVAERARSGEFEPTNEIADRREAEQRRKGEVDRKTKIEPSQLWRDCKNDLRAKFDDVLFNRHIVSLRGLESDNVLVLESPNRA